jgi:hypothetical protein
MVLTPLHTGESAVKKREPAAFRHGLVLVTLCKLVCFAFYLVIRAGIE